VRLTHSGAIYVALSIMLAGNCGNGGVSEYNDHVSVLTGIKPTGQPHLGNYLGAMRPALRLAEGRQAMFFVADYHALTTLTPPSLLRRLTYEVAASWLAIGLDPGRTIFYRQSDIPQIFELFWLLCCATPKGMVNRAHAYKALLEANTRAGRDQDQSVNMGLYNYPILMASDILLFDANVVPVGTDQAQHVEMARDIAARFNARFGPVLSVPDLLVMGDSEPITGLDGRKMSKSYGNTIPLFTSSGDMQRLFLRDRTDSSRANAPKDPDTNGLFRIYSQFVSADETAAVHAALRSGQMTWRHLKEVTATAVEAELGDARDRYETLVHQPDELERIFALGAAKARPIAEETLQRVRRALG